MNLSIPTQNAANQSLKYTIHELKILNAFKILQTNMQKKKKKIADNIPTSSFCLGRHPLPQGPLPALTQGQRSAAAWLGSPPGHMTPVR